MFLFIHSILLYNILLGGYATLNPIMCLGFILAKAIFCKGRLVPCFIKEYLYRLSKKTERGIE